jgi:hypothetical protein
VKVTSVSSAGGGALTFTFDIPASLAGRKQIAIRLQSSTGSGYFAYNWFYNNTAGSGTGGGGTGTPGTGGPSTGKIPTFSISAVVADDTVTILTSSFPKNDTFDVLMGAMGTRGVGGVKVTSVDSGDGGALSFTFDIPASLQGRRQIAIRLQSTTGSGYFAYNWFYNNTIGSGTGGGGTGGPGTGSGTNKIPTFSISAVAKDATVTILTSSFPKNDTFDVLMGAMGTRGVGGVKVTSVDSGAGGALTFTFNIPASLAGQRQIAIRLQSTTGSGYFAYNWFYNNNAP